MQNPPQPSPPKPPESGQQNLRIEKLVYGGDGLSRDDGRVVLTPFVLPGELIRAEVHRAKNDLLRGKLQQVLEPAPERIEAACPYFARCGGCHYQHASHDFQSDRKRDILREVLRRVGRVTWDSEIPVVAADPWHYRNRTQLHIAAGGAGYFASGSHSIVPVDHCPISSPKLNEAIAMLARDLPHYRGFETTLELFTDETTVQVNILDRIPTSVRPLFDDIGTGEPLDYSGFRVSRNSFFQVNRFLIDKLVETALADAQGESAVDLYAGVGLFSRALAKRFATVTAVESGGSAFHDLQHNTREAESRVKPVRKTTEDYLAGLTETPDLIVADPPRAGLGKAVVSDLVRLSAPRLTIVSCDPSTLARDLANLMAGGYTLASVSLVDLFPQTFHLETIVHLHRT